MTTHDKTAPLKRFFLSKLFLMIAFPLAIVLVVAYVRSYVSTFYINQEIADLEADLEELETKKLESLDLLEYVMSDAFIEEQAKTELNLKRPGEQVMIIDESTVGDVVERRPSSPARQRVANPIKWWYYFMYPDRPPPV